MKKRNSVLLAFEIALLIIFCTALVYNAIKLTYAKYDNEMKEALVDMEKLFKSTSDKSNALNNNFQDYQKNAVGIGAYYLRELCGRDISAEMMENLKYDMDLQSLFATDHNRRVIMSTTDAYIPDFSDPYFDPLFEVSPDSPVSEQVTITPTFAKQKKEEADSLKQKESSLQDAADGDKQDASGSEAQHETVGGEHVASESDAQNETVGSEHVASESDAQNVPDGGELIESDPETTSGSDLQLAFHSSLGTVDSSMPADGGSKDELTEFSPDLGNSYISYYYNDDLILVFEYTFTDLYRIQLLYLTYIRILEGRRFGTNGFYMLIDPESGGFYYYPPADNKNAWVNLEQLSLPGSILKDGFSRTLNLSGKPYFCRSRYMKDLNLTLSCAVPVSEMNSSVFAVLIGPLLSFLLGVFVMRNYTRLLLFNTVGTHNDRGKNHILIQKLAVALGLILLLTVLVTEYSFCLYMYTDQIKANVQKSVLLEKALNNLDRNKHFGTDGYDKYVLNLTSTAADLIEKDSGLMTSDKLKELTLLSHAEHILVYDRNGVVIASDMNYSGMTLPREKESLVGEFYWVLHGEPFLVQHDVDQDYLHYPFMFCGAPVHAENGNYTGMVLLAFDPYVFEDLTFTLTIDTILENYSESRGSFVFTVGMDDHMVHSTDTELNGKNTDAIGLTENEMADGYIGFLKLRQYNLLGCCQACDRFFAYVVSFVSSIPFKAFQYSFHFLLVTAGGDFLFFLILILYAMSCHSLSEGEVKEFFKHRKKETVVAEEKMLLFIKRTLFLLSCVITLTMIFRHSLFSQDSLGYYIFVLDWGKGVYIFTITRCLIYVMSLGFILFLVTRVLSLLGKLLPSKQETIIRMLLSFLKYALVIVTVFLCLTTLGAPTASLLASAGVLTLVLSMGAQSLVADILSGFFIIFEGTYKVGDMITVDDWHGQVMEIGIRNTKIRDLISSDVKIMNNSTVKNVINFSVYPSFAPIMIGVEYGVDLHKLEEIVEREKPVIKKNIPYMIGELMYLGVEEFADSAVILKFQVACKNQDYLKAKRALNREIKLMFDRNGINVPFPQIVLNTRNNEEDSINTSAHKLHHPDEK